MSSVKFIAEIDGIKKILIARRYRFTVLSDKTPASLGVVVKGSDMEMGFSQKMLDLTPDKYGREIKDGMYEHDIVRFTDRNGTSHVGTAIFDKENCLYCIRTADKRKYPFYLIKIDEVLGSTLAGDKADEFLVEMKGNGNIEVEKDIGIRENKSPGQSVRNASLNVQKASQARQYELYVDGEYSPDINQCGAGFVLVDSNQSVIEEKEIHVGQGTAISAELYAAIKAIDYAEKNGIKDFVVCSDSQYLVDGVNKWSARWKKNGFLNSKGDLIKNTELWKALLDMIDEFSEKLSIRFRFIGASSAGKSWNDRASEMAFRASHANC